MPEDNMYYLKLALLAPGVALFVAIVASFFVSVFGGYEVSIFGYVIPVPLITTGITGGVAGIGGGLIIKNHKR
ncbi:MAG: hypothetical protein ACR2N8_01810 [Parvibaculales bacterium]